MLATALLLTASGFAAEIAKPVLPAAPSLIVLPEASQTRQIQQAPALVLPPSLAVAAPPTLVTPAGTPLQAEAGQPLVTAASQEDLARLTKSLAKSESPSSPLDTAFDGSHVPSDAAWDEIRRPNVFFAAGPHAPDLPILEATARSVFQRLLPSVYRPVAVKSIHGDSKLGPGAGHYWTAEEGHVIEMTPAEADKRGLVQSLIGADETAGVPGPTVQQKIEQLVHYLHEFSHAIFDDAVRQEENHAVHSAHTVMTEGFAVTLERLLIEGLLTNAPALGLSPRDAHDLRNIAAARKRWLKEEDNAYSEGEPVWRRAYEAAGEEGVLSLLSSLSARRLIDVPRADPAYQLALGSDELLRAYLGKNPSDPLRLGLEAYGKAARGEALAPEESILAARAVSAAGRDGRRRVFDRVLQRAILIQGLGEETWAPPAWLRRSDSALPAFALADLNEDAKSELAEYLAEAARSPKGLDRIFERPGPSKRLTEIVSRALTLPWTPADRADWDAALSLRLLKGVRP